MPWGFTTGPIRAERFVGYFGLNSSQLSALGGESFGFVPPTWKHLSERGMNGRDSGILSFDKLLSTWYSNLVAERVEIISQSLRRAICGSLQTLTEIEEKTGVDPGRLSRFLRGERTLTLHAVDALAKHFGLTLTKARKKP